MLNLGGLISAGALQVQRNGAFDAVTRELISFYPTHLIRHILFEYSFFMFERIMSNVCYFSC